MTGLGKEFGEEAKEKVVNFTVSAPGKVILHGEHSVVYGRLAVAASLGLRTIVQLKEVDAPNCLILNVVSLGINHVFDLNEIQKNLLDNPPSLITSNSSDFNWANPKLIDHKAHLSLIETQLKKFFNKSDDVRTLEALKCIFFLLSGILCSAKVKLKPVSIKLDSQLDLGAGMGSSASFAVGISALLVQLLKLKTLKMPNVSKEGFKPFNWDEIDDVGNFSEKELSLISDWAFCGEQIFHGTPSGLDNTICTYGNLVEFRKQHSPVFLKLSATFRVLLVNSMRPRQTHKMVSKVKDLKATFPQLVEHILDALEVLTLAAVDVIRQIDGSGEVKGYYDKWETLVQTNHSLLGALGVSDPKIEQVLALLEPFGLKGKLTGAGGGGYVLCILPPNFDPKEAIKALEGHGFVVRDTYLGGEGVRVDAE